MKYYFIVNPLSGNAKKEQAEENIRKACLKREIPYEIIYTKHQGEATKIAANISDEEECVVFSVGGDGSLNEVLNGIVGSKNKILGNVPIGSANDFERSLKMQESGINTVDLGKINGRYFINVACIGLDADVANNVVNLRHKKWIPVSQRYNASLVYTFFSYEYKKLKIKMGKAAMETDCTIVAVCNGQYYGGGYRIAPHALLQDGMFDIYVVKKMPKAKILPLVPKLAKGTHESSSFVERYEDSKIVIDCAERYTFNVDGETVTSDHFELEIEKSAIRVFNDRSFIEDILQL